MTIKHPFLYLCVVILAFVSGRLIWGPNLSFETKVLGVFFYVAFALSVVLFISRLEDLEEEAWKRRFGSAE